VPGSVELSPAGARALVAYNHALFDRFVRRVRRLPRRAAFRKRGIGHESFFDTLVHVLNAQEVWLVYIARGRNTDADLEPLFNDRARHPTDWKGFDAYAKRVWAGVDETTRSLTARRLEQHAFAFWMRGRYTVQDGYLQATLEEAHHLGEVIGAMWQDDIPPPDMTWIDVRRPPANPRRGRR
jgi:uncharacterized damage-inducible protein DinB